MRGGLLLPRVSVGARWKLCLNIPLEISFIKGPLRRDGLPHREPVLWNSISAGFCIQRPCGICPLNFQAQHQRPSNGPTIIAGHSQNACLAQHFLALPCNHGLRSFKAEASTAGPGDTTAKHLSSIAAAKNGTPASARPDGPAGPVSVIRSHPGASWIRSPHRSAVPPSQKPECNNRHGWRSSEHHAVANSGYNPRCGLYPRRHAVIGDVPPRSGRQRSH